MHAVLCGAGHKLTYDPQKASAFLRLSFIRFIPSYLCCWFEFLDQILRKTIYSGPTK